VKKHKRYPQALQQVVPNTISSSRMTEAEQLANQITTASVTFEGHIFCVSAVTVFPDRRRMVTASYDKTVRLWDLKDGVELERMEGHRDFVYGVAVSRDGQFIASGGGSGTLIAWNSINELMNP